MKIDYDKAITHLKIALIQIGEDRKSENIKNKIRLLINEIFQKKLEHKKQKINKKIKNNVDFKSKNPTKSLDMIEDLINKEIDSLEKKEYYNE